MPCLWPLAFCYRLEANTGQCRIVSSRTFLNAKITMPQIVGASDRQITAFNRFYTALLRHEMGHYAIGGETAFAIDYELTAMPPMQTCAQLEQQANSKAYERLQESYTKVLTYDELTRHGRLQGAVLKESLIRSLIQGNSLKHSNNKQAEHYLSTRLSSPSSLSAPQAPRPKGAELYHPDHPAPCRYTRQPSG